MSHTLKPTAAVLALLLSLGPAVAQSSGAASNSAVGSSVTGGGAAPQAQPGSGTRNSPNKEDRLARGDRKFVEQAAGSGMFEVQVGQLAASKASDPAVKSYASMLVEHHSAANNELTQLANTKGVELPAAPPRALRSDMDKLGKKSGPEFDRDYVREVGIKAHEKDIKLFEKASKDLKDPQLKAFAAKTLPALQQHLAQARQLPQSGGKGGKNDAAAMGNSGSAKK